MDAHHDVLKIFNETFTACAKGIFRFVYFKVSDYELAQDIVEDTFVRYWKVLEEGKKISNHKAFLYFIAKGLVIDWYRKKKLKRVSLESIDERLLETINPVEAAVEKKQTLEYVYKKIKQLKKEYQDVLFLHYVEDLSIKEIAFIQKKKENAIRVLVHRALKALKEML